MADKAEGKLSGRTVGIKDNIAVAGVPMRCGSKILEHYVPEFDASIVTRILDAGQKMLPPTHVACGLIDFAIGGDQGGSVRIPASFTGIVGLKPTYGLVPYTGAWAGEPTVDHLGPMARTVADCALLLEFDESVSGKKVGLLKEGFDSCTEDIVKTIARDASNKLTEAGMTVTELSIPLHRDGSAILEVTSGQAAYHCLLDGGEYMTQTYGRSNKFYAKANNLVMELTRQYDAALHKFDVIVMPTMPYLATKLPPADCSLADLYQHAESMCDNVMPFNSTGHPALTINAGFAPTDDGKQLPVGMMIVGRKFDDVTVLQVARAVEKMTTRD
nr:hypothetical protein BaRGS_029104 [Batillaria attramentaria]